MTDLVSIVTVARNSAKYIEQTLVSVRAQTYSPIEHLVFDACSDDGTQEILARYEATYDLRWVSEPDRGQSHAFNKGVVASRGVWLYFLNSDDYLLDSGAVERVMSWIAGHPGFSIYMGHIVGVDAAGRVIPGGCPPFCYPVYSHDVLLNKSGTVVHQGTFYHRNVFAKAGLYSEAYRTHMDYEFHLRASRYFGIAAMDVKVACFRQHRGAKSQQPSADRYLELFRARRSNGGSLLHRHNAYFLRGFLRNCPPGRWIHDAVGATRIGSTLSKHCGWGRRGLQ